MLGGIEARNTLEISPARNALICAWTAASGAVDAAATFAAPGAAGAEVLLVPAAFTMFTGKDHWHVLLRARAIENQTWVLAPGQFGAHELNAQCYGHSVIIDPWGTVVADAPNGEGVIVADLDFDALRKIRAQLPSLANRRPSAYREPATVGS